MDASLSITQNAPSPLLTPYLISFVFSSLLARATAPIPFLKRKISNYIIFIFLVKNKI